MSIQQAVRETCKKRGVSERAIAIGAGIEPGLFNAYVHGKRPNRKNAVKVAVALGVEPRKLFQNFDQLRSY